MDSVDVLLIGAGGGREHAVAWKLRQSPRLGKLYIAPGNAGTAQCGENLSIGAMDIPALLDFAKGHDIGLVAVVADDPLAAGVTDAFIEVGFLVFGSTKAAAEVEWSKAFAKQLMKEEGIPTAEFETFTDYDAASRYLNSKQAPIVIKASGLALGKGAMVCKTLEEAHAAIKAIMVDRAFGDAGNEVVIEEFLEGQEISVHAIPDGTSYALFPTAQDHKAIGEGDTGPNTGGIGMIAPVPWVTEELINGIRTQVVEPALAGLKKRGRPLTGLLYPGLMVGPKGFRVLEFNARFGDPEPQALFRLLKTDLLDVMEVCAKGVLSSVKLEWDSGFAACVVACSKGYPGKYDKGFPITGIEEAEKMEGVVVFHAGTKRNENDELVTNGGRVLGVSAVGATLEEALAHAYAAIGRIHFEGMYYRRDIGAKALRMPYGPMVK